MVGNKDAECFFKVRDNPAEVNERRVKTTADRLHFSRKSRAAEYDPCTVRQYQAENAKGYIELGECSGPLHSACARFDHTLRPLERKGAALACWIGAALSHDGALCFMHATQQQTTPIAALAATAQPAR